MASTQNKFSVWRSCIHFIAYGFGSGLLPKMPGTYGTVVGVFCYYFIQSWSLTAYLSLLSVFFILGVWLCHVTATDLNESDPSVVVWDEIVGYLVTMVLAPSGWIWMALGFILFRAFDIVKPWPIRQIDQKLSSGLGIMLDDVMAGIYANLSLQLIWWLALVFLS